MATVYVGSEEGLEHAVMRFKNACDRAGIKYECTRRVSFKSNSQRRRDKERHRRQRKRR